MSSTLGAGGHQLQLRDLELSDLPGLASFAPEEWRVALDAVLLQHIDRGYFRGRVAVDAQGVVAMGQGILTGDAGWIGNIIVRPEARRHGLGTRLTQDLVECLRGLGCSTQLLIATDLGAPIYSKLGFRRTSEYVFLRAPRLPPPSMRCLGRLQPAQADEVLTLDRLATGESRAELLAPHLATGWGHLAASGSLDGYFLPSLGAGLVVASQPAAGLELLAFKHAFFPDNAVVPATNTSALQFLAAHGAEETSRSPRMALGDEVAWRPEWIFARASGYCG
jgi:GNAT superfamily N-acetyltransferase